MVHGDTTGATVLLVDDDADALELLQMVMERAGYQILTAINGETALAMASEHSSDIEAVILDIMMPGDCDGHDVCDRLKNHPDTQSVPVIILSAKSSARDMARSYAMGAFQHITKPYDIQHLLAVVESMVRLRRLERESITQSEKYRTIVDHLPLEMLLISPDLTILEMNEAFRTSFPDASIGDSILTLVYDEPPSDFNDHPVIKALKTGVPQDGVIEGACLGRRVYRKVHAAPLIDADGNVSAVVDITEDVTKQTEMEDNLRRQIARHNRALHHQDELAANLMTAHQQLKSKHQELEETNRELERTKSELERLSITDALTGLYNRRHFKEVFEMETRRSSRYRHPLSVLMMDIDHFKDVNDTHGHPSGDAVLSDLAEIFNQHLRETDTIARYGGEEFVVILPESDMKTAASIGERLRAAVEEHTASVEGTRIAVTISVGVASVQSETIDSQELLAQADDALYAAKAKGRNQVITFSKETGASPNRLHGSDHAP